VSLQTQQTEPEISKARATSNSITLESGRAFGGRPEPATRAAIAARRSSRPAAIP